MHLRKTLHGKTKHDTWSLSLSLSLSLFLSLVDVFVQELQGYQDVSIRRSLQLRTRRRRATASPSCEPYGYRQKRQQKEASMYQDEDVCKYCAGGTRLSKHVCVSARVTLGLAMVRIYTIVYICSSGCAAFHARAWCIFARLCACVFQCVGAYVRMFVCTNALAYEIRVCMYVCMYTYIHTYMHICIYVCMYICMNVWSVRMIYMYDLHTCMVYMYVWFVYVICMYDLYVCMICM